MAKGKLTGTRPFAKGHDSRRNTKGAPKIPDDLKLLNQELKVDALKHLYAYWFMKVKTYQDTMKDTDDMTMGERMIGAAYGKAAKDGNLAYVEAILNRILGKPMNSDPQQISVNVNQPPTVVLKVADKKKQIEEKSGS